MVAKHNKSKRRDGMIIIGVHVDDVLKVFVRDGDELHQAGSLITHNGASPEAMATVVAELAEVLSWRQVAGVTTEVPQPTAPPRARTAAAVRAASHPAGKAKKKLHAVTVEQVVDYVTQHPEGVSASQIADALLPNDEQSRHTISNRLIAYFTRVARTNEMQLIHKVTGKNERNVVRATYYPGPD